MVAWLFGLQKSHLLMLSRCGKGRKNALLGIIPTSIWLSIVRSTGWPITIDVLCKMRCIEFLRLFFLGILNFGIGIPISQFFNSRIQKKIWLESLELKTKSEFCFQWVSQILEPKNGIPNQASRQQRPQKAQSKRPPWIHPANPWSSSSSPSQPSQNSGRTQVTWSVHGALKQSSRGTKRNPTRTACLPKGEGQQEGR